MRIQLYVLTAIVGGAVTIAVFGGWIGWALAPFGGSLAAFCLAVFFYLKVK